MLRLSRKLSKLILIAMSINIINTTNVFATENNSNITISNGIATISSNVTEIDSSTFSENNNITKVIIPSNVKKIGEGCFSNFKNLKEVIIEDGVKEIGSDAFIGCENLEKINIPSSITVVGDFAFIGCSKLKDVDFQSKTTNIGGSTFLYTAWLDKIRDDNGLVIINNLVISGKNTSASLTIPDGVKIINSHAFEGCNTLKEINIPDSVVEIRDSAFEACSNLSKVKLSNKLETIGENAFSDCKLQSVNIPSTLKSVQLYSFNSDITVTGAVDLYNSLIKPLKTAKEDNLNILLRNKPYGWGKATESGDKIFYKNSKGELQTGWMDLDGKKNLFSIKSKLFYNLSKYSSLSCFTIINFNISYKA